MKYDLLIQGGTVVDPSQGLAAKRDVAMARGKVAAVEPSIDAGEAAEVLDAEGLIVTPGWSTSTSTPTGVRRPTESTRTSATPRRASRPRSTPARRAR